MAWPTSPKQHRKQEPQVTVFEMAASLESGTQTPVVVPSSPSSPPLGSPASLSTTSIPNIQQATPVSHNLKGANFHGSFAAITARHKTKHLHNRPWYRRYAYFTGGWGDRAIWRAGVVEAVGTFCLTWLVGQFNIVNANLQGQQTTVHTAAASAGYVGLWSAVLLAALVAATAPGSGGHLNPMVTFSTVLCGLCPLSRGVIYVAFQMLGAAIAGACFYHGGGCYYDSSILDPTQVLLIEVVSCFILLFLIFGVGLDPRQAALFGPHLVPVLVGLCFGVVAFVSQGLVPGYAGANMNPAKCFGIAIATNDYSAQWIWWVGGLIGGIMQAILYNFNPPWQVHDNKNKEGTPRAP
ncbi:aquaporin-like protein [Apiospora rasikravindrae]|uniref:Aquaporin-like protein n=1 Tax=Apiospora rasikravindrae TaxID=990691 RepID=A0ABR1S200_9PEZI